MSKDKRIPKFSVSPLFVLLGAVMAYKGEFFGFVSYTAAIVLHELAHAEVAQRLGYTLKSLRLNPYGAALEGNFEWIRARDEITIASAGPIFNILLSVPAVALWWVVPASYSFSIIFVEANIVIAAFNLLPIFPLDGGRVVLALFSKRYARNAAYKRVRLLGLIFSFVFGCLFILTIFYKINFSLGITAIFMLISSIFPDKNSYYERLYSMSYRSERIKNGLNVREIMVSEQTSLLKLHKMLNGSYFTRFVVVNDSFSPIFTLTETELEQAFLTFNPKDKLIDIKKTSYTLSV